MYKSSFLSWINYSFSTVPIKVSVFLFLSCLEAKLPNASLSACLSVSLSLQESLLFINPVSEFAVSRSPNFWRDKNVWGTLSGQQEMQICRWNDETDHGDWSRPTDQSGEMERRKARPHQTEPSGERERERERERGKGEGPHNSTWRWRPPSIPKRKQKPWILLQQRQQKQQKSKKQRKKKKEASTQ